MDAERTIVPPHQARARRTETAIVDACLELINEQRFSDIPVSAIAERAGVSVGGFYARFRSKDALLGVVESALMVQFAETAERELDPRRFDGKGVGEVAHAYVSLLVTQFRAHRARILNILSQSRPRSRMEQRLTEFNVSVHDRMRTLLGERAAEIRGDVHRTINTGLFIAGAACREAVLTRNLSVYPLDLGDAELIEEIAHAFRAHLTGSRA